MDWISVKDRLPEKWQQVLIYIPNFIGTATGFRWLKADGSIGKLGAGETMPMPELPK